MHTIAAPLAGMAVLLTLLLPPSPAGGEPQATSTDAAGPATADCVKCHFDILRILDKRGGKHRDKLTCIQCHASHPPDGVDVIPLCSRCHQGKEHFTLPDCLVCHNPHKPLDITLPNRLTEPCLTCHKEQQEQLVANPSVHSRLGCTACHKQHGKIPSCFRCHEAHTAEQDSDAVCAGCHAAHRPLAVAYGDDTPSEVCGSCHPAVLATLRASKAKHASLACVNCHPKRHKFIPRCSECHGKPHSDEILALTPHCGDCHNIAHDLAF
ncbi:MAG: cytochrome C [Thermodesulfobacteriota bacterium]